MKKLWSIMFTANLVPAAWLFFLSHLKVNIPFDNYFEPSLSGNEYAKKIITIVVGAHIIFLIIFSVSRRTRVLNYLPLPNKSYWMSSPDNQLDALARLQDFVSLSGFFIFSIILFTQFYILFANIYAKQMKPQYLTTYSFVVGLLCVCFLVLAFSQFSKPKAQG